MSEIGIPKTHIKKVTMSNLSEDKYIITQNKAGDKYFLYMKQEDKYVRVASNGNPKEFDKIVFNKE